MDHERLEHQAFERLMVGLRPRLHRYCARMVGSAIDGEDVVQEALAKAAEAFPTAGRIERPESWLFRIAHNAALDALRRRKRQARVGSDADLADIADPRAEADARVTAAASLAAFMRLPAAQRSSAILVDVLGHSLEETADILGASLAATKADLHRARTRLRRLAEAPETAAPRLDAVERDRLRAYADRFNARDFDALRDLLAEDARLDLHNRRRLTGRANVSVYFTRYGENAHWRVATCLAEGRPALVMNDPMAEAKTYLIVIDWAGDRVARIRDFRFAPYVMDDLTVSPL